LLLLTFLYVALADTKDDDLPSLRFVECGHAGSVEVFDERDGSPFGSLPVVTTVCDVDGCGHLDDPGMHMPGVVFYCVCCNRMTAPWQIPVGLPPLPGDDLAQLLEERFLLDVSSLGIHDFRHAQRSVIFTRNMSVKSMFAIA
jgi:hypothetical protein